MTACTLVWYRSDLRTRDHAALRAAIAEQRPLRAVFLICAEQWRLHDWGPRRIAFVGRNVQALAESLAALAIPLDIIDGARTFSEVPGALAEYVQRVGACSVHAHREHEVNEIARDEACAEALENVSTTFTLHDDQCIVPPGLLRTGSGRAYVVFTPFLRSWRTLLSERDDLTQVQRAPAAVGKPLPAPKPFRSFGGVSLLGDDAERWPAGEAAALRRLKVFTSRDLGAYAERRDLPSVSGTSTLSPWLTTGVLSARQCLDAARRNDEGRLDGAKGPAAWITELAWRDFYRHILVHFPRVCRGRPFRLDTERVSWRDDDAAFNAWCEARTGIPIVDAAMRQLLETGWMHNRLRMVTAMFLTKNLLIDWRRGESFFMRHLIDGDFASNNGGWQWSASTGTDAAPYFRVFNPVSQGERFDADGEFLRAWLPSFEGLEDPRLHQPWTKPALAAVLTRRGYPERPIVDLQASRARAINAFRSLQRDE